jgi:hypothetical protein
VIDKRLRIDAKDTSVSATDPTGVTAVKYLAARERNGSYFLCDFMGCDVNET